ncbi:hypothetical protein ACN28C_00795 [Plantactinospora sp. WMMC1484]|uniref:hypothetical protein n=1 Tax=Plantactinospora sp. WMMC1484 TaxID=3404122 RepID=UPI003BF59EC2
MGSEIAERGVLAASTNLGRNVIGTAGRNGWNTAKNLANKDTGELFTPAGVKSLVKMHKAIATTDARLYGRIMKDATPAATAAGGINGFLPGNVGDEIKFRPENVFSGFVTNLFG